MRVAIIGGAGFIGTAIAKLLSEYCIELIIFDTKPRLNKSNIVRKIYKTQIFPYPKVEDLTNHFRDFDVLIHLACTTEPATSMKSIVFDANTNIIPSIEIFQAAMETGVKRIIFSSSGGTVYGNSIKFPVNEDDIKKPVSAYGVSKLAIEQYLDLFASTNLIKGINLRLANPYGCYQLEGTTIGIIAHYLNAIKGNLALEVWGDGSIVRDYIHIDSVSEAFVAAVFSPSLPSGSYNIGSGRGISINELIELLFSITGRKVPVKYKNCRSFDVQKVFLDNSRFKSQTSWQPEISLEKGILEMWNKIK